MLNEQLKSVLKNSASAVMHIAVNYLDFALTPMDKSKQKSLGKNTR